MLAQHSDGGIPKPTNSLFWRGFLNPLLPVSISPSKEALGLAPPPSVPTVKGPGVVLNTGLASGGLPRLEASPSIVTEGIWASDLRPLSVMSS
jgi:hypothetical protein